ncbi:MAG: SAM-dependent methyltransferase [Oligoflexales bacterium]
MKDIQTAYLAPLGLENQLEAELSGPITRVGRLFLSSQKTQKTYWAANIWEHTEIIPIKSIGDAAKELKKRAPLWHPYYDLHIRRAKLIQSKLPKFSGKRLTFLQKIPTSPMSSWTLLNENLMLASAYCSSLRPHGEWEFIENKEEPPSRAYLKLWEVFTRFEFVPNKNDTCLEIGAAPGGWTWVLADLCKKVIAYDRADLDPKIANLPNVQSIRGDAFATTPEKHPDVDWIFSDVICTPERLFGWLQPWLKDSKSRNFCTTIKLKGDDYHEWVEKFSAIPKSHIVHLYHNKHELTCFIINTHHQTQSCKKKELTHGN